MCHPEKDVGLPALSEALTVREGAQRRSPLSHLHQKCFDLSSGLSFSAMLVSVTAKTSESDGLSAILHLFQASSFFLSEGRVFTGSWTQTYCSQKYSSVSKFVVFF